jgi:hypothetical protein
MSTFPQEDKVSQFLVRALLKVTSDEFGKLSRPSCLDAIIKWGVSLKANVMNSQVIANSHLLLGILEHLDCIFESQTVVQLDDNPKLLAAVTYFIEPYALMSELWPTDDSAAADCPCKARTHWPTHDFGRHLCGSLRPAWPVAQRRVGGILAHTAADWLGL